MENDGLVFWLFLHAMLLALLSSTSAAAATDASMDASNKRYDQRQEAIPIEQAIERISRELNARVVVFGVAKGQPVTVSAGDRSALERLKSILKGYDYAIVYNDPSPSFDAFDSFPSTEIARSAQKNPEASGKVIDENTPEEQQKRLANKIEQLEAQIDSGEADNFFERWSRIKDPKYIFNHRNELDRLRERLAALD